MSVQRVALVTGGNRGIGLEICRQLKFAGIEVVLAARNEKKGRQAAEQLEVAFTALDVTKPESVAAAIKDVTKRFGRIDVLVNNAGIFAEKEAGGYPSALAVDLSLVEKTYQTNVLAPLRLIQAVVPMMREHGYGRIVNVSSIMGQLSSMGGTAVGYRSSKTALNAITKVVASELGNGPIKINAMHPGWVRTDMGGPSAPVAPSDAADTAVYLATLAADGPTGGFFERRKQIAW